jgi:hypothetical protein
LPEKQLHVMTESFAMMGERIVLMGEGPPRTEREMVIPKEGGALPKPFPNQLFYMLAFIGLNIIPLLICSSAILLKPSFS